MDPRTFAIHQNHSLIFEFIMKNLDASIEDSNPKDFYGKSVLSVAVNHILAVVYLSVTKY